MPMDPFGLPTDVMWHAHQLTSTDGDTLLFGGNPRPIRRPRAGLGALLLRFADVAHSTHPHREVAKLAKALGPLYLCQEHELPATHIPLRIAPVSSTLCPVATKDGTIVESVEEWLRWSQLFSDAIHLRVSMERDDPPKVRESHWTGLADLFPPTLRPPDSLIPAKSRSQWSPPGWLLDQARTASAETPVPEIGIGELQMKVFTEHTAYGFAVRTLLALGDVRPGLMWTKSEPQLGLRAESLFGALAAELAFLVAGQRALKWCAYGGHFYEPVKGEHHYTACCAKHTSLRGNARNREWRLRQAGGAG